MSAEASDNWGPNGLGYYLATRMLWDVDEASDAVELEVTGGLIAAYDRGPVRLELHAVTDGQAQRVAQVESPADGKPHAVTLRTPHAGLHKLVVDDGSNLTQIVWPQGVHRTIENSTRYAPFRAGRRQAYFYVPRGTQVVGGYAEEPVGQIRDAQGQAIHDINEKGYFRIPVPPGQDGRLWSFHQTKGDFRLLTVPPYSAAHPDELLLPREVVEADAARPPASEPTNE